VYSVKNRKPDVINKGEKRRKKHKKESQAVDSMFFLRGDTGTGSFICMFEEGKMKGHFDRKGEGLGLGKGRITRSKGCFVWEDRGHGQRHSECGSKVLKVFMGAKGGGRKKDVKTREKRTLDKEKQL